MQSTVFEPMDMATAEVVLKEAKEILDELEIPFFLRHGTCLGAVRDQAFIGWDDDLDIGSIIGMHGLTVPLVLKAAKVFEERGFHVDVIDSELHMSVDMKKSGIQMDWTCYHVIDDHIYQWPAVQIPASLHENLKEIEFLGEKFMVPNPPEEYFRLKYGPDWMTPRKTGFEQDILDLMPDAAPVTAAGKILRWSISWLPGHRVGKLRVLNHHGRPVQDAAITLAPTLSRTGLVHSSTDSRGETSLYLPEDGKYVLAIKWDDHEEILFLESLSRGVDYTYKQDPEISELRMNALIPGL